MDVYRAGRVALANAPGTGIADDKAVYAYVPQIIKYYLGEDIDPAERADVRLRRREAVRARAGEPRQAGRQADQRIGRLRHPDRAAGLDARSTQKYRELIRANPRNYIAQPMLALSRVPTIVRRSARRPARRPAAVHPLRQGDLRPARRADARGAREGLAGRQFVARRRQQGYLGA